MCKSRDIVPMETIIQPFHAHILNNMFMQGRRDMVSLGTIMLTLPTFVCAKCQPLFCINISCTFFIALYLLNSTLHASVMKGCFVIFSCRR